MKYARHKYFTIEWKKDSKLYLVDVARFHGFASYLAANHAEGYLKCKNQYNTDATPGEWVACTTERPWYSAPINWTIDSGIGYCIYLRTRKGLFRISTAKYVDAGKRIGGYKGLKIVNEYAKRLFNKHVQKICGFTDGRTDPERMHLYKQCNCRPMIWISDEWREKIIPAFFKADFSSAYPAEAGTLPDLNTAYEVYGHATLEEFPEYDFAFYIESGHIVERGRFSTFDIFKSKWYSQFAPAPRQVDPSTECVVFMKKTQDISEIWKRLYKNRRIDDNAKAAMVSTIGFFQSEKYNKATYMGHASAVIYLRHIKKMLDKIEQLEKEGNEIVMISTDSIGWTGQYSSCATDAKDLGTFTYECKNGAACIKANGVYAYQDADGRIIGVKHQGAKIADEIHLDAITDIKNIPIQYVFIKDEYINGLRIPKFDVEKLEYEQAEEMGLL